MDDWKLFCSNLDITGRNSIACFENAHKIDPILVSKGLAWLLNPVKSLLILGDYGTGKTYFMYCLVRGLLNRYPLSDIYFNKSKNIDDKLADAFREFGSCSYLLERLSTIKFLFIDDFGVEKASEKTEREYYEFIDRRTSNERPTIITSNLQFDEIKSNIGGRIHSRLKVCNFIEFKGTDIRSRL